MSTRRAIILAFFFLIAGLMAGSAAGWYATHYCLDRELRGIHHCRAAVEGKLQARTLQHLREGKSEETISILELLVDSNLVSLARLDESSLPVEWIDVTYVAMEEIRQYRQKYPREASSKSQQEAVAKTLSLNQRGQGNTR